MMLKKIKFFLFFFLLIKFSELWLYFNDRENKWWPVDDFIKYGGINMEKFEEEIITKDILFDEYDETIWMKITNFIIFP